jgi:hypothetical protein
MSGWQGRSVGLAAALAFGVAACGGSDGSNLDDWASAPTAAHLPGQQTSSAAPTVEELRQGMVWEGEFTIVIEVWDQCNGTGQMTMADRYTKTESFSFQTAPSVDHGPAARESNPFFVSGGTDPTIGGPVGLAFQSTGVIALPGQEDDPYVLQFWELEYETGHLTGRLFEDGSEMGLDWNRISDDQPLVVCQPGTPTVNLPFPMKEGATLDATISDDLVTVVVVGRSYQEERRWRVEATATRTG